MVIPGTISSGVSGISVLVLKAFKLLVEVWSVLHIYMARP